MVTSPFSLKLHIYEKSVYWATCGSLLSSFFMKRWTVTECSYYLWKFDCGTRVMYGLTQNLMAKCFKLVGATVDHFVKLCSGFAEWLLTLLLALHFSFRIYPLSTILILITGWMIIDIGSTLQKLQRFLKWMRIWSCLRVEICIHP